MNRRNFLKSAVCLAAFPSSILACDIPHLNVVKKRKLLQDIQFFNPRHLGKGFNKEEMHELLISFEARTSSGGSHVSV